mmetsp:Transcript_12915/g.22787  ORF Transcript_12915/g.22787 Transcript_12915/m.22787 type:complete len:119 (+) Transcript_12915:265-621(+)
MVQEQPADADCTHCSGPAHRPKICSMTVLPEPQCFQSRKAPIRAIFIRGSVEYTRAAFVNTLQDTLLARPVYTLLAKLISRLHACIYCLPLTRHTSGAPTYRCVLSAGTAHGDQIRCC